MSAKVICVGEVLWDKLPSGMFLGGAPLNVAVNLRQLGVEVEIISAVGKDELGSQTTDSIWGRGLSTDYIQQNNYPTGVVEVEVSEEGQPDYEIKWPASWDFIEWNNELDDLISESDIMVYGSLAQRSPDSKRTIQRLLGRHNGTNIFDINLRPPFNDRRLITQSLERADILKLNEDELRWLEPDKAEEEALKTVLKKYDLEAIILTKGAEGATLFRNNSTVSVASENVKVKDTVGAGDAFLAGAIYGIIHNKSPEEVLKFANQLGGFVASNEGATPELDLKR